jgi:hypothetical protein
MQNIKVATFQKSSKRQWRGKGKRSVWKTHISYTHGVQCMNVLPSAALTSKDRNIVPSLNKSGGFVLDPYVWRKTKVGKHPHSHCWRRPARLGRVVELLAFVHAIKDAW